MCGLTHIMNWLGLILFLNLVVHSTAEEGLTGTYSGYSDGISKEWMPSDREPLRRLVESLLERMERQETRMQRMEMTIQDNMDDLKRKDIRINNLERELDEMKTLHQVQITEDKHRQYNVPDQDSKPDLPQEERNTTDGFTTSQKLPDKHLRPVRVPPATAQEAVGAFSVALSKEVNLHSNFVLTYDEVNLDRGCNYNKADGVYTVPVSGVYVFTWTSTGTTATDVYTELIVDGSPRGTILTDADSYHWDISTGLIVTSVSAGDHVFVRSKREGHMYSDNFHGKVTFSGWRLS